MTRWLKQLKVSRAKFDRYLCTHCHDALIHKLKHNTIPPNYFQHVQLYKHQSAQFKLQRGFLGPNQVLILYDFSTIHETAIFKVKNLSCCVWWNTASGKAHHYFDFFACAKHDHRYIDYVFTMLPWLIWDKFRVNFTNKEISIWSDGGTKSNNSLGTFKHMGLTWRTAKIALNFFAPHHGHSIVDAHFGTGKRLLRKKFPPPNLIRNLTDVLETWRLLPNTTIMHLESLDRVTPGVKRLVGIRSWFEIIFPGHNPSRILTFGKTGNQTTFLGQHDVRSQ